MEGLRQGGEGLGGGERLGEILAVCVARHCTAVDEEGVGEGRPHGGERGRHLPRERQEERTRRDRDVKGGGGRSFCGQREGNCAGLSS